MRNQNKQLALYCASFLSNFGVVGLGLGIFEDTNGTIFLGLLSLALGAFITWKVEK